jgi:hypothetical protein
MQAFDMGVTRLAAQVMKLKQHGHNIVTENMSNGKVTYARYHLVE